MAKLAPNNGIATPNTSTPIQTDQTKAACCNGSGMPKVPYWRLLHHIHPPEAAKAISPAVVIRPRI